MDDHISVSMADMLLLLTNKFDVNSFLFRGKISCYIKNFNFTTVKYSHFTLLKCGAQIFQWKTSSVMSLD